MKSKKTILLGCLGLGMCMLSTVPVYADSVAVNFESPDYALGNINGQDGWSKTGGYDSAVVDSSSYGYSGFGSQSLRISNGYADGAFGGQTFATPLSDSVGEADATNGTFSPGYKQRYFVMEFDIASAVPDAVSRSERLLSG